MSAARATAFWCLVTGFVLLTAPAQAVTVSIALQHADENGGAITEVASAIGNVSLPDDFIYGTFGVQGAVLGNGSLNSNLIATTETGGTLSFYATGKDIASPVGPLSILSGFTQNLLTAGWSVSMQTFLNPNNLDPTQAGWAATAILLSSIVFNTSFNSTGIFSAANAAAPYSLTELFVVSAPGAGDTNSSISLTALAAEVPLPGTAWLLVGALIGLCALTRKRSARHSA